MSEEQTATFQHLIDLQHRIQNIHPFLAILHPIALLKDKSLHIYDFNTSLGGYTFVKRTQAPGEWPADIAAAFPLEQYNWNMTCVVSSESVHTLPGQVTIFHEFIHCQQFKTCEPEIKHTLSIAQKALQQNDYMWELNHPFPYENAKFIELYRSSMEAADAGLRHEFLTIRHKLRSHLCQMDYEYLVWQEWKEGFARYIENMIRNEVGLLHNDNGVNPPFDRVSFYAGGSKYIHFLSQDNPQLKININALFHTMFHACE